MWELFGDCIGFDWDEGNAFKNWDKHRVTAMECEEVFFNKPLLISGDARHSDKEKRFYFLGRTHPNRFLFGVCTIRQKMIRVISTRDMNQKERQLYEKEIIKENSET